MGEISVILAKFNPKIKTTSSLKTGENGAAVFGDRTLRSSVFIPVTPISHRYTPVSGVCVSEISGTRLGAVYLSYT